jgi:hypothetical protein
MQELDASVNHCYILRARFATNVECLSCAILAHVGDAVPRMQGLGHRIVQWLIPIVEQDAGVAWRGHTALQEADAHQEGEDEFHCWSRAARELMAPKMTRMHNAIA